MKVYCRAARCELRVVDSGNRWALDTGSDRGQGIFYEGLVIAVFALHGLAFANFRDRIGICAPVEADRQRQEGARAGISGEEFLLDHQPGVTLEERL